jgi:hypothetical protein
MCLVRTSKQAPVVEASNLHYYYPANYPGNRPTKQHDQSKEAWKSIDTVQDRSRGLN